MLFTKHGTHNEAAQVAGNGEKALRVLGACESFCTMLPAGVSEAETVVDIVTVRLLQRQHSAGFSRPLRVSSPRQGHAAHPIR
jgi:hypothetical protein